MQINVATPLYDYDGVQITEKGNAANPEATPTPYTVAVVLVIAATCAPPAGKIYERQEQIDRYQLGGRIRAAAAHPSNTNLDLTASESVMLQNDICRLFGPILAGQVLPLLDG